MGPLKDGKVHVTEFYTSKITGALCITVSGPLVSDDDDIIGVFGGPTSALRIWPNSKPSKNGSA